MSEAVVAKRYADALIQLGNEKGTMDQFLEDMSVLKEIFHGNNELYTFLKHPKVNNEEKERFLTGVFNSLSIDIVNTMKILVERNRVDIIPSIIDHFIQLVNDAKGIADGTVYSVRELADSERENLEKTFAKRFNKKSIHLTNVVDAALIGGIKIRIGNTILDGTISGKLKRMERNIVTAN